MAPGIRSIAAPVRDEQAKVTSAVHVTVHAAETSQQTLVEEYLPHLLKTAGDISADWARCRRRPHLELFE